MVKSAALSSKRVFFQDLNRCGKSVKVVHKIFTQTKAKLDASRKSDQIGYRRVIFYVSYW